MAVVLKKDEKVKAVIEKMSNPEDIEEFKSLFKQMYPDDCAKIQKTYLAEERKDKIRRGRDILCPIPRHI